MVKRIEFNASDASDIEILHAIKNGRKIYHRKVGKVETLTIKEHINSMIKNSPIVARCEFEACGKDITQAEIDLKCADSNTCSQCLIDKSVYKFGFDL